MSIEVRRSLGGFSLIELIMAMVVITVGILALVGIYSRAAMDSVDPLVRKQALSLAESLMDEVLRAPHTACDKDDPAYDAVFRDPSQAGFPLLPTQCSAGADATNQVGEETVNGSADACPFDNVDDYHAKSWESGDMTCLGTVVPADYKVSVNVSRATLGSAAVGLIDGTGVGGAADGDVLRILVTATAPDGQVVSLEGFRTRYAPGALP